MIKYIFLLFSLSSFAQVKDYLTAVDKMPIFPGCEMITNSDDCQQCTEVQFSYYIEEHIIYPKHAIDMGCEGVVIMSFIIRKDGSLSDIEVLKDQTSGCGLKEAAIKVLNDYALSGVKWCPGFHNNERVNVKMVIPIKFGTTKKNKKKK